MRKHWPFASPFLVAACVLAAPAAQAQNTIEHGGYTYVADAVKSNEAHRWSIMHRDSNRKNPFDTQCRGHASFLQVNPDALCGDIRAANLVPAVRSNGYLYDTMTVNGGRVQGTTLYALGRDVVTYSTSVEVGDYLYVIDYYKGPDGCFNVAVKRYRKVPPRQTYAPPPEPLQSYTVTNVQGHQMVPFNPVLPTIINSNNTGNGDCCDDDGPSC